MIEANLSYLSSLNSAEASRVIEANRQALATLIQSRQSPIKPLAID